MSNHGNASKNEETSSDDEIAISLKEVSKSFGEKKVLQKVSFEIKKGEALCLLGRSGTGKSVTLKLIIGLLKVDEGTICVYNQDIGHVSKEQLSKLRLKMGFLFQNGALFDSFNLNNNLAIPLKRFNPHKSDEEIQHIVREKLSSVGLGDDGEKMSAELSGGMLKRAGLARAMMCNPGILLADEPSSGLDRITSTEIDHLLLDLKKNNKTSMIIVTHDIESARRLGDRIAVLDGGRLVACGAAEDLEKSDNELVRKLVSLSAD